NRMEIKIEISEGDISVVKPGMPVDYSILSDPETVYHTTLSSIDPGLTTLTDGSYKTTSSGSVPSSSSSSASASAAVYYYGNSIVDNKDGPLRIGMTIRSTITVAEVKDALLAPSVAITTLNGTKSVRVLTPTGEEQKTVTTGLSDGVNTQILTGLEAGEEVITAEVTQKELEAELKTQRHPRR
ncbi:MAG: efflux transporter periplasmic adaptor subunit, partial [Bilophila sp.]